MTSPNETEKRRAALSAHISDCERGGFQLESRTDTQAILVRRSRLERFSKRAGERVVIWVDEHGTVEKRAIEARRW